MNKTIKIILLLLSFTTQCMKRNNIQSTSSEDPIIQNSSMQDLKNKRNELKKIIKSLDDIHDFWNFGIRDCPNKLLLSCTYHQDLHKKTYGAIGARRSYCREFNTKVYGPYNINNLKNLSIKELKILKKTRSSNKLYSALGSAAIAEEVSFQKKRKFIQKLLDLNFTPTPEDKDLAMLATYEEFGPAIIEKKLLLQHAPVLSEMYVPQDVINYIALLIFKKKLLF